MRPVLLLLLVAGALAGCSQPVEIARPPHDLCPDPVDGPQCTEDVIAELGSRLQQAAQSGSVDGPAYEQAASAVISDQRIAGTWGYTRLDAMADQDGRPVAPVQFQLSTAGHVTQWWVCLPEPVVQQEACV